MGHGNRDKEIIHMEELRWKDSEVKPSKVSMWIKENAKEQELIRIKNKKASDAFHNRRRAI